MEKIIPLRQSNKYNKMLIQGILNAKAKNYTLSKQFFENASKLNKSKMEPHFYLSMLLLQKVNDTIKDHKNNKRKQIVTDCMLHMDKAI